MDKQKKIRSTEGAAVKAQSPIISRQAAQLALCVLILALPLAASASGAGMPWEGWMAQILNSMAGPYAKVIGALLIMGCGIGIANGEGNTKKAFQVGTGLSVAFTASSFFLNFLGFSGGAVFGI
ncbi:TrbC/VirB2 family protein (plasmid) [Dyella sp. BiH032]|uniref:TrbC/VirB2 family protein n=1 Tax=Dyella sp. BiH032 TaxID=3075430 RepID=UPI0028930173|nr:TrbC/VirB2 family protein [Dyella sp. BiH032]WNL48570.1 TrbC/VirB2 family protein [Dyella sp. BiH032]